MSGGGQHEPAIRNDKITWTDGFAPLNCPYLRYCVKVRFSLFFKQGWQKKRHIPDSLRNPSVVDADPDSDFRILFYIIFYCQII